MGRALLDHHARNVSLVWMIGPTTKASPEGVVLRLQLLERLRALRVERLERGFDLLEKPLMLLVLLLLHSTLSSSHHSLMQPPLLLISQQRFDNSFLHFRQMNVATAA